MHERFLKTLILLMLLGFAAIPSNIIISTASPEVLREETIIYLRGKDNVH